MPTDFFQLAMRMGGSGKVESSSQHKLWDIKLCSHLLFINMANGSLCDSISASGNNRAFNERFGHYNAITEVTLNRCSSITGCTLALLSGRELSARTTQLAYKRLLKLSVPCQSTEAWCIMLNSAPCRQS